MERLTERTGEGQAIPRMDLKNNGHQRCMERLAEYEDLEEQNRLLKLPCAVGDTVYTLNPLLNGKTVIGETTADAFFCALVMLEGRFGKTVFLTREEAEAALKEFKRWRKVNER